MNVVSLRAWNFHRAARPLNTVIQRYVGERKLASMVTLGGAANGILHPRQLPR